MSRSRHWNLPSWKTLREEGLRFGSLRREQRRSRLRLPARPLRLESLESRQLLSASPPGGKFAAPAGLAAGSAGNIMVTVDTLFSSDSTPPLTGTIDDTSATVVISVNGQVNLPAVNNANGTWTLPDGSLTPLAEGVYNVVATATNSSSEMGMDSTTNELTIDQTAPVVTVNSLSTSNPTPTLTGTVNDPTASVFVEIGPQTILPATNNGDGTWTLSGTIIAPLAEGTYDVVARAVDLAGNTGFDSTTGELEIDTIPIVAVDVTASADSTPPITGTVDDPTASIIVSVGGQVGLVATNHGDGTWTLPNNVITPLADGVYDVSVTATDATSNIGTDTTANELTIDTDGKLLVVNSTPVEIPGEGSSGVARPYASTIHVTGVVGGLTDVDATLNQFAHSFPADVRVLLVGPTGQSVVLLAGTGAGVSVSDLDLAFDDSAATHLPADATLTSGTYRPTNLVSSIAFPSPAPAGPYGGAFSGFNGTNPNGEWGLYIHDAGNLDVGTLAGGWSLAFSTLVDTVPPVVTVNPLVTGDTTPPLTGTVDDPTASVFIDVGGQTNLPAINHGDGTWSLPDNTLSALSFGVYNVEATAIDSASNAGFDITTSELSIIETNFSSFANTGAIAIPATGTSGPAGPYPAAIAVAGLSGEVIDVDVTLTDFAHSYPTDIDLLLVGPGGESVVLMSGVGSSFPTSDLNFTFDDAASGALPTETELSSGTFTPTNARPAVGFASPAPAGPYGSSLSTFNGVDPNGTWNLFAVDTATGDAGEITGGWSLTFETTTTSNLLFGDADNDGFVKGSDLLAVIEHFGSVGVADGLLLGDADDNGVVSGGDLLAVIENFGRTLPGALVSPTLQTTLSASTTSSSMAASGGIYLSQQASDISSPAGVGSSVPTPTNVAATDAALLLLGEGERRERLLTTPSSPFPSSQSASSHTRAIDTALAIDWQPLGS